MLMCRLFYLLFSSAHSLKDRTLIEEICVFRLHKEPASLTHKQRNRVQLRNAWEHLRGFDENVTVEIFDGGRDA